jgi:hypothetical protein
MDTVGPEADNRGTHNVVLEPDPQGGVDGQVCHPHQGLVVGKSGHVLDDRVEIVGLHQPRGTLP